MKLTVERDLPLRAEDIWARLGPGFVTIDTWLSVVTVSHPVAAGEMPAGYSKLAEAPALGRVTTSKVVTATEILTEYSDKDMTFGFDAVDTPAFMLSHSRNRTVVTNLDDQNCRVTIKVDLGLRHVFVLLSPLLKSRMSNMLNKLLDEVQIGLPDAVMGNGSE